MDTTSKPVNLGMTNPIIRKLTRNAAAPAAGKRAASYGGIGLKTGFFLLLTFVGIALYFFLHSYFAGHASAFGESLHFHEEFFDAHIIGFENVILIACLFIAAILPLLAWAIRPLVFINGSLYALAQGYLIAFVTNSLEADYKWIALLAMILTMALVVTLLFLYAHRLVRVTKRFRTIVSAVFLSSVLGGLIVFVLNLIPGLKELLVSIQTIIDNPILSIISSVLFIVLASLFLLADFNAIEVSVEKHMDKKYEWMAAFGLAYTVIYLYFKILNLLLQLFSRKEEQA